ncbi:MAG: hypothetical protein JW891_15890 [Candidatus Lokiarchaeota archaeon]|nr:hypothetical protein [Candidatus Lokiarchaeota archaeon]
MMNNYIELEDEILKQVNQLLTKQSNLTIKSILKKISKNISKVFFVKIQDIEAILKTLIKKNKIVITIEQSQDSFQNQVDRKKLFTYIHNYPGKSIEELCRALNLTRNQVIWHLTFLKKIQYIWELKNKKESFYFPNNNQIGGVIIK